MKKGSDLELLAVALRRRDSECGLTAQDLAEMLNFERKLLNFIRSLKPGDRLEMHGGIIYEFVSVKNLEYSTIYMKKPGSESVIHTGLYAAMKFGKIRKIK